MSCKAFLLRSVVICACRSVVNFPLGAIQTLLITLSLSLPCCGEEVVLWGNGKWRRRGLRFLMLFPAVYLWGILFLDAPDERRIPFIPQGVLFTSWLWSLRSSFAFLDLAAGTVPTALRESLAYNSSALWRSPRTKPLTSRLKLGTFGILVSLVGSVLGYGFYAGDLMHTSFRSFSHPLLAMIIAEGTLSTLLLLGFHRLREAQRSGEDQRRKAALFITHFLFVTGWVAACFLSMSTAVIEVAEGAQLGAFANFVHSIAVVAQGSLAGCIGMATPTFKAARILPVIASLLFATNLIWLVIDLVKPALDTVSIVLTIMSVLFRMQSCAFLFDVWLRGVRDPSSQVRMRGYFQRVNGMHRVWNERCRRWFRRCRWVQWESASRCCECVSTVLNHSPDLDSRLLLSIEFSSDLE